MANEVPKSLRKPQWQLLPKSKAHKVNKNFLEKKKKKQGSSVFHTASFMGKKLFAKL